MALVEAAARLYGASRIYRDVGFRLAYPDCLNGFKAEEIIAYAPLGEKCLKYFDSIKLDSRGRFVLYFLGRGKRLEKPIGLRGVGGCSLRGYLVKIIVAHCSGKD